MKKQSLKEEELIKNRIIVRIWTSEHNINSKGMHKGHVSLELAGKHKKYISLINDPAKNNSKAENKNQANFNDNFDADKIVLNRDPQYTICLYTLDQDTIIDKEKDLENKKTRSYNNANYIWELLQAGRIQTLIPTTQAKLQKLRAAARGGLHAKIGAAVAASKMANTAKVPLSALFASEPKVAVAASSIAVCKHAVATTADEETTNHPIEAMIDGKVYAANNLFSAHSMNADALIKILQIAKTEELKNHPATALLTYESETKYFEDKKTACIIL